MTRKNIQNIIQASLTANKVWNNTTLDESKQLMKLSSDNDIVDVYSLMANSFKYGYTVASKKSKSKAPAYDIQELFNIADDGMELLEADCSRKGIKMNELISYILHQYIMVLDSQE